MFIYPLSRKQYVYGMMIARTSNEISQINKQDEISRCNARAICGKGRVGLI